MKLSEIDIERRNRELTTMQIPRKFWKWYYRNMLPFDIVFTIIVLWIAAWVVINLLWA